MSSIKSSFISNVKRNYLKSYLINQVRELEKFASNRNSWGERPDIILILTKLLCNGKETLFNGSMFPAIEKLTLETPFYTLEDLEKYCNEFIKQTKNFAYGDVGYKPRVKVDDEEQYHLKEIKTTYFLEAQSDSELLLSLDRILKVSKSLDAHLKEANFARREILLRLLKPTIYPLLVTIEQMYEALT